jgi:Skp family chaperone for outer membrane proteins
MATKKKEPMISQTNRPTAIDYDVPISNFKLRDLVAVVNSQVLEHLKYTPQPEFLKPEKEFNKPEKELRKPEKELLKTEKELVKSEKELLKPEKERLKPELSKPEKEFDPADPEIGRFADSIAARVVEILKSQGIGK